MIELGFQSIFSQQIYDMKLCCSFTHIQMELETISFKNSVQNFVKAMNTYPETLLTNYCQNHDIT